MGEESPKPSSTPTGAVFLSYASEDAAAAERIASALRGAGIEAWIDKSELRGGDAWDQSIRSRPEDTYQLRILKRRIDVILDREARTANLQDAKRPGGQR